MKIVVGLLVLLIGSWVVYAKVLRPEPVRACERVASLCGVKLSADDEQQCASTFEQLAPDDRHQGAQCIVDAKSCGEAVGCASGTMAKMGMRAAGQFLEGFGRGMK